MRITEKKENSFYELKEGQEIYGEENGIRLVQIVGQLEDIAEELSINLITFWKLLTRGCYYKVDGEILYTFGDVNIANRIINTCYTKLNFKDYGKTWALTKEELL